MSKINLYRLSIILVLLLTLFASCKNKEQNLQAELFSERYNNSDIDEWIALYLDDHINKNLLDDSKKLITRLSEESPQKVELFINSIANNDELFDRSRGTLASIVAYAYGIDIPAGEYSEISNRLLTFTRLSGRKAPQIEGLSSLEGFDSTLVLFYDGSCGICQHILEDLATNYELLTTKKVRIVTISADGSKDAFEQHSKKYPWTDKICDYQSFNSVNFKKFGIAATPTLLLIDKNGIVAGHFESLKDTGLV